MATPCPKGSGSAVEECREPGGLDQGVTEIEDDLATPDASGLPRDRRAEAPLMPDRSGLQQPASESGAEGGHRFQGVALA